MARQPAKSTIKVPGGSVRLIKPLVGFQEDIAKQLEDFPFEKNVFMMMRFRDENKDLSDFIIETLDKAGLRGVRADQEDWNITNNVYNPIAVLYCCKYGIALFDEAEENQAYNPNVVYELGIMHSLRRACLILLNDSLPRPPFDLIKDLYMPYKGDLAVRTNIQRWLKKALPAGATTLPAPSATPESRLEHAAVSAQKEKKDSIVGAPEGIAASDLTWGFLSQGEKESTLSWAINLVNKGPRSAKVKVQVLFLDRDGFALDDYIGPVQTLSPNKPARYEAVISLSPQLASRLQHTVAIVSKPKR